MIKGKEKNSLQSRSTDKNKAILDAGYLMLDVKNKGERAKGYSIAPGTAKGDNYCARSSGIKKCKNPPCANDLSRKAWGCVGKKSVKSAAKKFTRIK